jgi:beta-fructofuranosidase
MRITNGFLLMGLIIIPLTLKSQTDILPGDFETNSEISRESILSFKHYREKLLKDPYRPAYHFCIPEGLSSNKIDQVPFDPNGAFFINGRYHLMYLYKRFGEESPGWSWGHVSSNDLINWRNHPDALIANSKEEGAFSGGAFIDDDGKVILSYWKIKGNQRGVGLAKNIDNNFDKWEKFKENPVIKSTEWGITSLRDSLGKNIFVGSADPSNIWKKNGKYYLLTGNLLVLRKFGSKGKGLPANKEENVLPKDSINYQGDRLYLFESKNLIDWNYLNEFYDSNRKWTRKTEDNMCPSFLPLPSKPTGGISSSKHLLLFISHNKGCQYYVGDYKNNNFFPNNHGRMSWNDNGFFAPEAMIDGNGRQIMWAWIFDYRPKSMRRKSGWSGTYSLPRSLWLGKDGTLRIRPVEELKSLRINEKSIKDLKVKAESKINLNDFGSDLMELEIIIESNDSQKFGLNVLVSDDGLEKTVIYYDSKNQKIIVDTQKSGHDFGNRIIEEAPLKLDNNETLTLRVFIDNSIIEVFANERQAIARRVYPEKKGDGISLFSNGGDINIESFKSWELMPSNPF